MKDTIIDDAAQIANDAAAEKQETRSRFRQDKFATLHLACFRPSEKAPSKV
ncbi:MAG: hypothetical protein ACAH83_04320 [Alphaproteobacteria bacterium]